jgi:hypothetical protein
MVHEIRNPKAQVAASAINICLLIKKSDVAFSGDQTSTLWFAERVSALTSLNIKDLV